MAVPASTTVGVTAAQAAQQGKQWAELRTSGQWLGWLEFDPVSARHVLLIRALNQPDAEAVVITPEGYSVRGAVHEYGGGSWALFNDGLVFVNTSDQRLYWQSLDLSPPNHPPEFSPPKLLFSRGGCCYGDLTPAPESLYRSNQQHSGCSNHRHLGRSNHHHLVLVEEVQPASGQPQNRLVAISFSDQKGFKTERTVLAEGEDFYSSPAFSPDGQQLAWLSWNHPYQPWLSTTLSRVSVSVAFSDSGKPTAALSIEWITQSINAEAQDYSLYQPGFDANGRLLVMSDQPPVPSEGSAQVANSWWQLVSCDPESGLQSSVYRPKPGEELGIAQWQLGTRTWAVGEGRVLASGLDQGEALLGWIELPDSNTSLEPLQRISAFEQTAARYHSVCWSSETQRFYVLMESVDQACQLLEISSDTATESAASPDGIQVLQQLQAQSDDAVSFHISPPKAVVIDTPDLPLYGHYYPALKPSADDAASPLIIQLHGGPTAYADSSLDLQKHYWTHQGFGLLMLNYRGSSGFGRQYRHALKENWGVSDVEDVLTACEYSVAQGWTKSGKLFVRGNSAGGYTVLQVLSDPRAAQAGIAGGASLYGISDLLLLNAHTHKFESRYLSWLIGDPETQAERFRQRSPIEKLDDFNLPVIFFQGDRDRVVPPPQTRRLYDALQGKGVLSEYCLFEGEGHGFRKAEHRQQLLERELDFYLKVLATGCL